MRVELKILAAWAAVVAVIFAACSPFIEDFDWPLGLMELAVTIVAIRFYVIKTSYYKRVGETALKIICAAFFVLFFVPPEMYRESLAMKLVMRWLHGIILLVSVMFFSWLLLRIRESAFSTDARILLYSLVVECMVCQMWLLSHGDIVYLFMSILLVLVLAVGLLGHILQKREDRLFKYKVLARFIGVSIVLWIVWPFRDTIDSWFRVRIWLWLDLALYASSYSVVLAVSMLLGNVAAKVVDIIFTLPDPLTLLPSEDEGATAELAKHVLEMYGRLRPLAEQDGVYRDLAVYFADNTPHGVPGSFCYATVTSYYYGGVGDRGGVSLKEARDLFDVAYWVIEFSVHQMAFAYELRHRVEGKDSRRIAFPKMLEYMAAVGPQYHERAVRQIEGTLQMAPYDDEAIVRADALRREREAANKQ